MATKISTEILIMILNNVQSPHDLHSSLLVNRNWCRITIPILWKLPLGQECCWLDDKKLRKKALCIRTYISCMNTQTRTLLIQNGFDLSSSPPQATFDYLSFNNKFIINNLVYFISLYSQQIFGSNRYSNNNNNNEIIISTEFTESRILFLEICKLIIKRSKFLNYFELAAVPKNFSENFFSYSDLIGSILELPDAPKVFKKLESFISMIGKDEQIFTLYKSLKLICDNILNMDLQLSSLDSLEISANLISAQKRLENLLIVDNNCQLPDYMFWAIISQKETLKSLRLNQVSFNCFERKSSPIGQFISLQELYIENCHGLHLANCLFLVSSFTQLSSFHCTHSRRHFSRYPQDFIIKILETTNNNLKNICLDLYPTITFDVFSAILNYCTKVNKLTLHNLSIEQVKILLNNNFNELRTFSFDCGQMFDSNELLCQMAKNVPKSLETIEFKMGTFRANNLRKFFKGWCKKGERNKKIIVKRTERAKRFTLRDKHFKVIEEYGVQFNFT